MVIPVVIDVNQLNRDGKNFCWPEKPSTCPKCGGRLWWHGFVTAYLSCFPGELFFRRLFCSHCRSTHRLRPIEYWPRFSTPSKIIEEIIYYRHQHGRWCSDLPRARQRQWWRRLVQKTKVCLGLAFANRQVEAFSTLLAVGAIPVSSVMECGNSLAFHHPT